MLHSNEFNEYKSGVNSSAMLSVYQDLEMTQSSDEDTKACLNKFNTPEDVRVCLIDI